MVGRPSRRRAKDVVNVLRTFGSVSYWESVIGAILFLCDLDEETEKLLKQVLIELVESSAA